MSRLLPDVIANDTLKNPWLASVLLVTSAVHKAGSVHGFEHFFRPRAASDPLQGSCDTTHSARNMSL